MKRIYWDMEKCQAFLDENHFGAWCLDSVYINNRTKMNIRCKRGHIFHPIWSDVLGDHWCPKCDGLSQTTSSEYIINYLNEYHPGCIWHDPTEYKNCFTKLHITCEKGHAITPIWNHIRQNHWCLKCASLCRMKSSHEINNYLNEHHPGCVWLDSTEYKGAFTKLHIRCENKHDFNPMWNNIQHGGWCPDCLHKHQTMCKEILEKLLDAVFGKLTGKYIDANNKERKIYFDGYNEKYKIAFEYNGEQHYSFHFHHHNDIQKLNKQYQRDVGAWKYCLENDITLIVIPYWVEDNKLERYIKDELTKKFIL